MRTWGKIEGVSYLVLLGIAMPMKYLAGIDIAVSIVGWIHGGLFILLAVLTLIALLRHVLSFWYSALVMIAALLPFGPFVIDRYLVRSAEPAPHP